MRKKVVVVFFMILGPLEAKESEPIKQEKHSYLLDIPRRKPFNDITRDQVTGYVRKIFVDTANIWHYVLSLDTMRLLLPIVPSYLMTRQFDTQVHKHFYDRATHTNKNQPKGFIRDMGVDLLSIPFVALSLLGWFSTDAYMRREAQLFTTGLIWVWASKIFLKQIKTDHALRPWHENYSCEKRSYGGSPSGHLSTFTFLTSYWAFEWGLKWALPMGLFNLYVLGINVAVNHHYLSQVFAGASLGLIFGVAAHSAFEHVKFDNNIVNFGLDIDQGRPGIKLSYSF